MCLCYVTESLCSAPVLPISVLPDCREVSSALCASAHRLVLHVSFTVLLHIQSEGFRNSAQCVYASLAQ